MSIYTLSTRLIRALLLGVALVTVLLITAEGAASFTEFYCTSGGSNLNAGSTTDNNAVWTSTGGNWTNTTRTFTPTDGHNPVSDGVAVGMFAAVYVTSGATVATYVGRLTTVTNATNGTLVISATNNAGTDPSNGTGTMTIKVGGAWKGPSGSTTFPLNLSFTNLVNTSSNYPRLNLKNDQTYSMTATTLTFTGATGTLEGYTTNPGDGGKATIDGGGINAVILAANGGQQTFRDLIITNGLVSSSTAEGFTVTSNSNNTLKGVVVNTVGGVGIDMTGGGTNNVVTESEVYNVCKANGATCAAMALSNTIVSYSIVHNNPGTNVSGFSVGNSTGINSISHCVSALNGKFGASVGTTILPMIFEQADFYGNGSDAIKFADTTGTTRAYIRNCNFVLNVGYGVNTAITTGHLYGFMDNCGFGAGTKANGGTTNNTDTLIISGSVTYANDVTPWTNPDYGNFSKDLAAAEGTGRGVFTETGNLINNPTPTPTASGTPTPYTGTIGYPDIGAADAQIGEPFPTPTFTPTATATATATSTATATPTATATAAATATATATATPTAPIEVSYGFSQ